MEKRPVTLFDFQPLICNQICLLYFFKPAKIGLKVLHFMKTLSDDQTA